MAHNLTRYQHSVISRATMPLNERTDVRYRKSPLLGYSPELPRIMPTNIFSINFRSGVPKDFGKFQFSITENNNPVYRNNSPFNGLSLYAPADSDKLCYLPYDSNFTVRSPLFIDAWVYVNNLNLSGSQDILSSWEDGNIGLYLENGYLTGTVTIDSTDQSIVSPNLFKARTWAYVLFAYDGKRMVLYEGLDEYVQGMSGLMDIVSNPLVIGGRWVTGAIDTDYSLDGYIAYAGMGKDSKNYREIERYLVGL